MRKILIILSAILLSAQILTAAGTKILNISFGPWVQNVTEDSFTVLWVTESNTLSWIEYGRDTGATWYQTDHECCFETVTGRRLTGTYHCVTVSGLEKGSTYCYRIIGKKVIDDTNHSAIVYGAEKASRDIHRITTLDSTASECRFSMVNDMHFDDAKYAELMKGMNRETTDFIVLNGDIVSFSNSLDTIIRHTFGPISDIAGDFPVFFARGNHETRGREFHLLPKAFPTNTGEFYYTFRHGPVAFIVLDAGEDKPDNDPEYSGQAAFDDYRMEELEWLKKAVESPEIKNAPKKVCIMHIPASDGTGAWYAQHWAAQNFTPVLNQAGIDLMLSAHTHRYSEARKGEFGNDFPIVTNSNNERLDFQADADKIVIRTFDRNGALMHLLEY